MPRHVDPDDDSFRRSLLRAFAGGVAAMVITFAITAALTLVGRDTSSPGPAVSTTAPVAVATTEPAPASDLPPVTEPPGRTEQAETEPPPTQPAEEATSPVGSVTVQVLDTVGTGEGPDALEAAEVLRQLGYDVVAVNPTRRSVTMTTVLASPGSEADARALRGRDERFAEVERNDGFNESVDLHVLVAPGTFAD